MERIIDEFNSMRSSCYHWEEPVDDYFIITYRQVFYDCLINEGQASIEIDEKYCFTLDSTGASKAKAKYDELIEKVLDSFKGRVGKTGENNTAVEGEDYSIRMLPHELFLLYLTDDGDFVEVHLSFPNWFYCHKIIDSIA